MRHAAKNDKDAKVPERVWTPGSGSPVWQTEQTVQECGEKRGRYGRPKSEVTIAIAVVQVQRSVCSYFAGKSCQGCAYIAPPPPVQERVKLTRKRVCGNQQESRQAVGAMSYSDGLLLPSPPP